ncbi:MAG TPA: ADP-ribose pyrophosphatase [Pseudonocardiaceae bacterium]|nr:ADP-ribose pyrophosphatase [Pseudonocardiaceae bacterium]
MDRTAPRERSGATDLLLRAPDEHGKPLVLMQRRAATGDGAHGWGLPEAAPRRDETPVDTALRVAESLGADPRRVRLRRERVARGLGAGPVSSVLIADVRQPFAAPAADAAWVPESEVSALDLDAALAAHWPALQAPETGLLIDAANVVGSRPDGWWRDRVGAAGLLLREVAAAAPGVLAIPEDGFRWICQPVVVLEGAAKQAADVPGVEVIRAPGSGDDTIAEVAGRGGEWVVVTADRGLRARLPARVRAIGPSTLRSWLAPATGSR